MSIFDDVKVDRKRLPGDPPAFIAESGHAFQTKSLDSTLATYEITAEGRLALTAEGWDDGDDGPRLVHHHGDLVFYGGNSMGGKEGFSFTRDGEDCEWVTYRARFVDGVLESIAEVERTRGPALPVSAMQAPGPEDEDDPGDDLGREAELLAGRTMFRARRLCGTDEIGEYVEVIADGEMEWCVKRPDGRLEIVRRWQRGQLYASPEDAAKAVARGEERRRWERERLQRLMETRNTTC